MEKTFLLSASFAALSTLALAAQADNVNEKRIAPIIIPPTDVEPNPYQFMGFRAKADLGEDTEPNDPEFWRQWQFFSLDLTADHVAYGSGFAHLWNDITPRKRVRVAVLDDGFTDNDDVVFVDGYNFARGQRGEQYSRTLEEEAADECTDEDFAHGLGVAGVIGAISDNNLGIAGLADVDLVAVKVLNCGWGMPSEIADGIIWAAGGEIEGVRSIEKVDVINMSLAGTGGPECPEDYQRAIDFAHSQGVVVVAAAGNHGGEAILAQPANCNHVITVGATDRSGHRATFSGYGDAVDLSAPGDDVIGWGREGKVVYWSGTSFATPMVTAAAALSLTEFPELSSAEIKHFLMETAYAPATEYDEEEQSCYHYSCGAGILDAHGFINEIRAYMSAEFSYIAHALSEGGDCNRLQALIDLNGALSLCDSYKVVFDSRRVYSESVTYKLFKVPNDEVFALYNAEMVVETEHAALVTIEIDPEQYQYGYQMCADGDCGEILRRMDLEKAVVPEACAAR